MATRRHKIIEERNNKKLEQFEKQKPDGDWITLYQGHVYMAVDGVQRRTPEKPTFGNLSDAISWLTSE